MLKNFKKILCPVELPDESLAALPLAKRIAQANDSVLYVMHVVRQRADPLDVGAVRLYHDERAAETRLEGIAKEHLEDIQHLTLVRVGNPAEDIIKAQQELAIDLVVMATHGRTGVLHLLRSGVAERVIHDCACPVLTVSDKVPVLP